MKAIGIYQYLPIENEQSLIDVTIERPAPEGKDILVAVKAISVNPVDTKVRAPKADTESEPRILGWDAAGEVVAVGNEVEHYQVGDSVYYAGDITRAGSYAEFQLVDERIVGKKPTNTDYAQAAAMPLTSITAWEALFDRLGISSTGGDAGKAIMIIGGAGGVGSIAIQLASKLAKLKVIATASRPETAAWCQKLGADFVINHRESLEQALGKIDIPQVDYIFCLNSTGEHWRAMTTAIAPQGMICSIVETPEPLNLEPLKSKSAGFVWEFMFTRAMYKTADMIEQQHLLNKVSALIEAQTIITTENHHLSPINAANLRTAHTMVESGRTIGKVLLSGW